MESFDSERAIRFLMMTIAWALFLFGGAVFVWFLGKFAWFWFAEIVPFHWRRGNYFPLLIPLAIAAIASAVAIAETFEKDDEP